MNTINKIQVKVWDELKTIDSEPGETILQAAISAGLEPPFSCQIGVCGSCKAKLISGKIKMEDSSALNYEEIDNNYILTCQSYPLDNDVSVDFDAVD